MKRIGLLALSVMALLVGCNMSGCNRGVFSKEPFVDKTTDAQGNSVAADTPRNWQEWREEIDPQLRAEATGKRPPGYQTWNEKWVRQLQAIETTQENAPKYIAYIIEERQRAGLPGLVGYPLTRAP